MSLDDANMSLVDHLRELRFRLIRSLYGIILGMGVALYYAGQLMDIIRRPVQPYLPSGGLVFTGVLDKFLAHIKIGLFGGIILSCPFWLYHVWKFISPALYEKERKYLVGFIVAGSLLFAAGCSFVYFLVFPAAFQFLFTFGGTTDLPMITLNEYISFFTLTTIMFGVAFEMPLILVVLALIGLIDAKFLREKRRYAIVLMALISAIITPPDALSMIMMLVPLVIMYEGAIIVISFLIKKKPTTQ